MRMDSIRQDASWNNYRKALGKEDREAFDEMIRIAQTHAPAMGSSTLARMEWMILAILLEQEKEIGRLHRTASL